MKFLGKKLFAANINIHRKFIRPNKSMAAVEKTGDCLSILK